MKSWSHFHGEINGGFLGKAIFLELLKGDPIARNLAIRTRKGNQFPSLLLLKSCFIQHSFFYQYQKRNKTWTQSKEKGKRPNIGVCISKSHKLDFGVLKRSSSDYTDQEAYIILLVFLSLSCSTFSHLPNTILFTNNFLHQKSSSSSAPLFFPPFLGDPFVFIMPLYILETSPLKTINLKTLWPKWKSLVKIEIMLNNIMPSIFPRKYHPLP